MHEIWSGKITTTKQQQSQMSMYKNIIEPSDIMLIVNMQDVLAKCVFERDNFNSYKVCKNHAYC